MAVIMIGIGKTTMAAAGTATVTSSASPWSSIAGTLVEDAETTTDPAVASAVVVAEVITVAAATVANTVVAAEVEAIIVAAAVAVAIIVAAAAVATTAVAVAEVITAAAEAVEVISAAAVVAEISVAVVVVATLAGVEETSKEVEVTSVGIVVTSMGVAVTSEAAEETSEVVVVAASAVALVVSSATTTTSTLVTEVADPPIPSKDRKDTTIKIVKAAHSRNTATDPPGITTIGRTTTAGSHEAECAEEAEEAHAEATLAGHPETEAVCTATSHPVAARTTTTTIASLQRSSKAVACAVEVTCV